MVTVTPGNALPVVSRTTPESCDSGCAIAVTGSASTQALHSRVCSAFSKSATAISIKTARTGFTTSERVHHLAEGLGLEVVMGNQIDGQIGSACAVTFGAAFQLTSRRAGELSNFLDMSDDLLAEPLRIRDGLLRVPPGAGLGIDIDPDKLAHYRTDRR